MPAEYRLTLDSKKPARGGLFKSGSSDWTRTSDIRINSPPFYRLNYRGIVEAYLSGQKSFVKRQCGEPRASGETLAALSLKPTIRREMLCRIGFSVSLLK